VYKLPETLEELTVWRLAYTTHEEFLQEIINGRVWTVQTSIQVYHKVREWVWQCHVKLPGTVHRHPHRGSVTYALSVAGIDVIGCYEDRAGPWYEPEHDLVTRGLRSNRPIPVTVRPR
jgi:hypothetical protein